MTINRNVFLCDECGEDWGNLGRRPHPGHLPTCSRRGARVSWLTMIHAEAPGVVAQCKDGHAFWEGTRRRGDLAMQEQRAQADVRKHNATVHGLPS